MTDFLPFNATNFINGKVKGLKRLVNKYLTGEWSIKDNTNKRDICEFDTILDYSFESGSELPSYPLQQGGFNNYNKVLTPNKATVTLAISGNKIFLKSQLEKLEGYNESLKLVDLILPFKSFIGYNLCNLSYSLGEGEAVNMLKVKFDLVEIRQVTINFKSVKANFKSTVFTGKTNATEINNQSLLKKVSTMLRS